MSTPAVNPSGPVPPGSRAHSVRRPAMCALIAALGVLIGAIVGVLGEGLRPAPATILDQIGRIEVLLPPAEARSLAGLHSLTVELRDVDDYGRVYVNNYLAAQREIGDHAILDRDNVGEDRRKALHSVIKRLGNAGLGPADARRFLKPGRNYIVAELENSQYGSCSAQLHITINGAEPLGFPVLLGEGLAGEGGISLNKTVKTKFQSPGSNYFWLINAICARRIYELDLN